MFREVLITTRSRTPFRNHFPRRFSILRLTRLQLATRLRVAVFWRQLFLPDGVQLCT